MTVKSIKAASAMVKCLEMEEIKVVFGYPGAAICPFYNALSHSEIHHILVRHEQNAGHAANGYARITGKPGVCIATSGPGATNLITAIATAYMDSVPMIVITGQVSSDQIGRDVFQEADITGAAEPFVKHSYLVKSAVELPRIFKEAFYIAGSGRKGPVLIDVPIDVQETLIDFHYPADVDIRSYKPSSKGNSLQIKRVVEAISEAEKPLICLGGGIFSANACSEAVSLAEYTKIPMVTTMMGISTVSSMHPLAFGMIGMHGKPTANYAINKSDLLILIGARVGDRAVRSPKFLAESTKIIHIDIDPAEIGKNMGVNIPVVGDAKRVIEQIMSTISEVSFPDWSSWIEELSSLDKSNESFDIVDGFVNPMAFITKLSDMLPEENILVADVGQNQIWSSNFYKTKSGRFLTSGGMGTMGYSVPAAIGAKLASPNSTVIAVCGDGSFQMQMMELATLCQDNIPVKIVIMTNHRLGMVRELQTNLYGNNLVAVFLDGSPDFIKLAGAYGIPAERINSINDAEAAISRMLSSNTPYLLECCVDSNQKTIQ